MKYITRTSLKKIEDKYENIIGWGTGPLFLMNYKPYYYKMDFLIDGTGKTCGTCCKGIPVKSAESLRSLNGKSLIIIYAIYEKQIIKQINKYRNGDIDIIIYSLLDIELYNGNKALIINAKNCEDMLALMIIRHLELDVIQFLEIGVCHPVIRNNTYLIYEQFSHIKDYRGVLIEANPLWWDLIHEYRSKDKLVTGGVGDTEEEVPFYVFPDLLGHSTFVKSLAEQEIAKGYECQKIKIKMDTINNIVEENFDRVPDLLALDAEGLDYSILLNWDNEKYPFKIVISEIMEENDEAINKLMDMKGYRIYARTLENILWIKKDQKLYI